MQRFRREEVTNIISVITGIPTYLPLKIILVVSILAGRCPTYANKVTCLTYLYFGGES